MLKQRAITAVVALAMLGIALFVLPYEVTVIVIAALFVAGAWEWSGFFESSALAVRAGYAALVAVLIGAGWFLFIEHAISIVQVAAGWWLVAFVWTFFFPTGIPMPLRWICGILVLVPAFFALAAVLRGGATLLLFALLIVWAADIGAYFAGKNFGRVKLAPAISPGKTWEGVIGGLVVVSIVALSGSAYLVIPWQVLLPFSLAVAAISIVGDLTVSMFKRTAGLKDSGKLFPGHGGVLDRIDSIAAAMPLFALGMNWLGVA